MTAGYESEIGDIDSIQRQAFIGGNRQELWDYLEVLEWKEKNNMELALIKYDDSPASARVVWESYTEEQINWAARQLVLDNEIPRRDHGQWGISFPKPIESKMPTILGIIACMVASALFISGIVFNLNAG